MIITIGEIAGLAIVTIAIGYIFSDIAWASRQTSLSLYKSISFADIKFAAAVAAPAVILHELFHKFVAMAFGLPAVFKVWWMGLGIALLLKLVHSPILIIAPGYVVVPSTYPLQNILIAAAGPFANLSLWLISALLLKQRLKRKTEIALLLTKQINKYLFIFNMLPIPPLDGYNIVSGIFALFI